MDKVDWYSNRHIKMSWISCMNFNIDILTFHEILGISMCCLSSLITCLSKLLYIPWTSATIKIVNDQKSFRLCVLLWWSVHLILNVGVKSQSDSDTSTNITSMWRLIYILANHLYLLVRVHATKTVGQVLVSLSLNSGQVKWSHYYRSFSSKWSLVHTQLPTPRYASMMLDQRSPVPRRSL